MHQQNIVICGGGLTGLASSISLSNACPSCNITLIERGQLALSSSKIPDPRTSALSYSSALFLNQLGIWQTLAPSLGVIEDIRVVERGSPLFLHFNKEEADYFDCSLQIEDGDICDSPPMGYIAENKVLKQVFLQKARTLKNLTILDGVEYEEVSQKSSSPINIALNNGEALKASLLINAEGKFSKLRELAGVEVISHNYNQKAVIFNIKHEMPHNNTAVEMFLPNGPFAVLPLADANYSSIVFTEDAKRADIYLNMNDEEFLYYVSEKIGGYLGEISLATERFSYPLGLLYAKNYASNILPRCITLGDACHTIHPIAGQGFNLSIKDIEFITQKVTQNVSAGVDLSINLAQEFERERKPQNLAMIMATHKLNKLFGNDIAPIKLARNLGLAGVQKIPFLKKHFIRNAMGV